MGGESAGRRRESGAHRANPYAAPLGDSLDLESDAQSRDLPSELPAFYVVSLQKFWLLSCSTFGFYTPYWFFAQFRRQRQSGMKTKPVLAAIFSIFTAHRLFKRVDRAARLAGLGKASRATKQTAPYICLVLASQVVLRVGQNRLPLLAVGLVLFVASNLPLALVQARINRVVGDPMGRSNARLSVPNMICVAIGGLFYLANIAALLATSGRLPVR